MIKVLLFNPSPSAKGILAQVHFSQTHLVVEEPAVEIPLDEIGVTLGGFDHKQLFLFWHQEEGRWAITPQGAHELRMLLESAPAPLDELLRHAARDIRHHGRRFKLALAILALALLLPLVLAGLFYWQSNRIVDWIANHISLSQENQLGRQAFSQATSGLKLRQSGADWQAIRAIGQQLTQGSKYTYHWYVADDPSINAFAIPGGYVVVDTGLIRAADSTDEIAGVLAHEVQHVEQRHTLKNMIHSLGWRIMLSMTLGDVSGGVIADAAANLGDLKYSRELESEADRGGLHALKLAGISPQGMLNFFARLAKQDGGTIPFLSTHPASELRLQALQHAIALEGNWNATPLPYDWKTIRNVAQ
jgi:Zn-dependent protease with chaperone function